MYMEVLFQICAVFIFLKSTYAENDTDYILPNATIQALKPKGFRISIPGDPRINLFHVEANFYNPVTNYYGGVREFVVKETNGRWMYENRISQLKVGDVVRYYIFVSLSKGELHTNDYWRYIARGYASKGQNFVIKELEDPEAPISPIIDECKPTVTRVLGKMVCAGQVLLDDNFDTLREDLWQIDQYIPVDHSENPFVSYQRLSSNSTVFIKDGTLRIQPKPQQDLTDFTKNGSLYYGKLDLNDGCTGQVCNFHTSTGNILPPIVSGRLSSRIAFTYGLVEIRAKMPIGDWIYPELLLEPFSKKYGSKNSASGLLKIATVFGNVHLNEPSYTNRLLKALAIINTICKPVLESTKEMKNGTWSDDFHVYAVKWKPDSIELFLDGQKWGHFRPGADGLRSWMPRYCRNEWYKLLDGGGKMAPFDTHFFLSLSMAVGGTEFPDDLTTSDGKIKPWKNFHQRAWATFMDDRKNWYPTWTQPLIVDYVKITAL